MQDYDFIPWSSQLEEMRKKPNFHVEETALDF